MAKNRRDLRLGTGHTFGFVRHDPTDGFAEFVLVAPDDAGDVVACAHFVPFVLGDSALPVNGCDVVNGNRLLVHLGGQGPDAISEHEPMSTYAFRVREDGRPVDP